MLPTSLRADADVTDVHHISCIDRPGEAGWSGVGVAGAVDGFHLKGVAAVRQTGVILRAGAVAEATTVQLALEG